MRGDCRLKGTALADGKPLIAFCTPPVMVMPRKAIGAWLKTHRVDTLQGKLRFDGPNNYGDDLMRVKQVQNGHWVVVWPKEMSGGVKLSSN